MSELLMKLNSLDELAFANLYVQEKKAIDSSIFAALKEERAILREDVGAKTVLRLLHLNVLTNEEKGEFFERLVSADYLFFESTHTENAVAIRSTAAFLLSQLVYYMPAINDFSFAIKYLCFEKDGRGMLSEEAGWSDAISSAIDLLVTIVNLPNFDDKICVDILQAIRQSIWQVDTYSNCEEERIAKLIIQMLNKNLQEEVVIEWIEQLFDKLNFYSIQNGNDLRLFKARANTLNVMRAFYFATKFSNQSKQLTAVISLFIQKNMN